jgi:hypothetical protein
VDVDLLIEQWRLYAKANRAAANENKSKGDNFGAELCLARGAVRLAAADLLELHRDEPIAAAKQMHKHAGELRQHHWPFVGFDEAAIRYTKARTWQDCAKAIDPGLPEVQPKLSD